MGKRGPGAKPIKTGVEAVKPSKKHKGVPDWRDAKPPMPERVIAFVEELPITSGILAGQTMRLRDWQKDFILAVYGPQEEGRRLVRTALLTLPRKNGKTQLAAALALAHLCGPCSEMRGQIYSAASDRNQASLIFREMTAIIERVPWMADRMNIRSFNKLIEDSVNGSTYEALSSDARKAHGLSPSFVVCDEVAQWRGRELYDNLLSGMDARAEPLTVAIGTQAASDQNLMSELVDYGQKILGGEVDDPTFHATIYRAPDDCDPWDESVWRSCNPALGDFKALAGMRAQATQARRVPAKAGAFKNLHLNMRIDAEVRFIAPDDWKACGEPVNTESLYRRPCWAGLDLSSVDDLTALVLHFPDDGGAVVQFFWLPQENIHMLEHGARVPYRAWADQGLIELTPGRAIDYRFVARRLAQVASDYDLRAIAYDRWKIDALQRILDEEGIRLPLVPWGQGYKDFSPAVDALEAAILDGRLRHGNNPVLTWNMSNACLETDAAGNRKLSKKRSREKIDGVVALCMAMGLAVREAVNRPFSLENIFLVEL
jgi:phage terminase large subunit-like protein